MLLPLIAGRPNCNWALIEWSDLLNRRWKFRWVSNFGEVKLQMDYCQIMDFGKWCFGLLNIHIWIIAKLQMDYCIFICGFRQIMCCLTSKFTWISPNDVLLLIFFTHPKMDNRTGRNPAPPWMVFQPEKQWDKPQLVQEFFHPQYHQHISRTSLVEGFEFRPAPRKTWTDSDRSLRVQLLLQCAANDHL